VVYLLVQKYTSSHDIQILYEIRSTYGYALYRALKAELPVQPIFIFDTNILDKLTDEKDGRVTFLHDTVTELDQKLQGKGSSLQVYYGDPVEVMKTLSADDDLQAIYTNKDYERYAINRDEKVAKIFTAKGKEFKSYKDQVIFEYDEVTKDDGLPYTVFTPYKRKWMAKLESRMKTPMDVSYYFKSYPTEKYFKNLKATNATEIPTLKAMGFQRSDLDMPTKTVAQGIIKEYDKQRNFPAIEGTSRLGLHFRFGTISIREKARKAQQLNETFLSELVWRDFYSMILQHFPHVETDSFREKYDYIEWRDSESDFKAWCEGKTGYPIVDAGMRELNSTGHMHNRVRMIVASFLTKHLLINWRKGERYFAEKLLDYDLASNSGGWQWAAGCGTDAAPYFRVFNPYTQADKFDRHRKYIKKWVPEVDTDDYVEAIVEHKFARERCLEAYKSGLAKADS